jgi:capsular polysaccharide transport system permease protein
MTGKRQAKESKAVRSAVIDAGEQYQRRRLKRFFAFALVFVGIPTLLGAIYYGFVASDFYISESKFVIHSNEVRSASAIDTLLPSTFGSFSARELYVVQAYVLSHDAMDRLNADLNILEYYQDEDIDYFSRLPQQVSREQAFAYYQDLLEVIVDSQSGVATMLLRAPTPELAQIFSRALLEYSEEVVNNLSDRAQIDQIAFASSEVDSAEAKVIETRLELQSLQRQLDEFNPLESASGVSSIRMELESELVRARTELEASEPILQPNAHQLVVLRNKIASLERQIASEKDRLVDEEDGALNVSAARFEALAFEKEFAEQRYASALQFLEASRVEALQQGRYLSVLSTPSLPEEPTFPRRIFGILTVFGISFFVFSIGGITVAVVREHAKV